MHRDVTDTGTGSARGPLTARRPGVVTMDVG